MSRLSPKVSIAIILLAVLVVAVWVVMAAKGRKTTTANMPLTGDPMDNMRRPGGKATREPITAAGKVGGRPAPPGDNAPLAPKGRPVPAVQGK